MASKDLDDVIAAMHPRASGKANSAILNVFNNFFLPEFSDWIKNDYRDYFIKWSEQEITYPTGATGTITALADAGGGILTVTSAAHKMAAGQEVIITGTDNNNGTFTILTVATNTFTIRSEFVATDTGAWQLVSGYGIIGSIVPYAIGYLRVNSTGHGLKTGMEVVITDETSTYDGTYIIYDYFDDYFIIAGTYSTSPDGWWKHTFGYELPTDFGEILSVSDSVMGLLYQQKNDESVDQVDNIQVYDGNVYIDRDSNFNKLFLKYWIAIDRLTASTEDLPFPEYIQNEFWPIIIAGMDYHTFSYYRMWEDVQSSSFAYDRILQTKTKKYSFT